MSGVVTTVTINGNVISVYGSVALMDTYMSGSYGDKATAYAAASTTAAVKANILVAATRAVDRQRWMGSRVSPSQPLEAPRTGLVDKYGTALPDGIPDDWQNGVFELASALLVDADIQTQSKSGSNIKSLGAGSARIEYFRPTDGENGVWPDYMVQQLLGPFLASSASGGTQDSSASGLGACSQFDDGDAYNLNRGY